MRSSLAAALMSIGGIFVAFAAVVFMLVILASRGDPEHKLATMSAVAFLVAGAVLFGLGFLLNRIGRVGKQLNEL